MIGDTYGDGIDYRPGSRLLTVGDGGIFATIVDALEAAGSRWVNSKSMVNAYTGPWPDKTAFTATFTNGSAVITKTAGQDFQGNAGLNGQEFLLVDGKYYRVKSTTSTTAGELFGPFKGTTGSYTCIPQLLDWITIMLLPGSHKSHASTARLKPGMILSAMSKESTSLVEDNSGAPVGFAPMTKMVNLSLEPNLLFGSMDSITYSDALLGGDWTNTYPYGCEVLIDAAKIVEGNDRGPHAGGNIGWPTVTGGVFALTNSELEFGNNVGALIGGGEAGITSRLLLQNIKTRWHKGLGNPLQLALITDSFNLNLGPMEVNVIDCHTDFEDFAFNPTSGPINIFQITDANTTLNINGGYHRIVNNNAAAAAGEFPVVVACYAGVVNVQGGSVLEATGSTITGAAQGKGVYTSGGVVNVRSGCRVKGDAGFALHNVSGTINLSPNADQIGGTTGIITALAT